MVLRHITVSSRPVFAACVLFGLLSGCGGGNSNVGAPLPTTVSQPLANNRALPGNPSPDITLTTTQYRLPAAEYITDVVAAMDPANGALFLNTNAVLRSFLDGRYSYIKFVPYPNPPPTLVNLGTSGVGFSNNGTLYSGEGFFDSSPECSPEACTYIATAATPRVGSPRVITLSEQGFNPIVADATTDEKNRYEVLYNFIFVFTSPQLVTIDLSKPTNKQVTLINVGVPPPINGYALGTAMARGTGVTWVAQTQSGDYITRVPDIGPMKSFPIALNSDVHGMAVDRTGYLWFCDTGHNKIGRMSPAGSYVEHTLPPSASPTRITLGSDGALWFIEPPRNALGRMTATGHFTEYALPSGGGSPVGIAGIGRYPGRYSNLLYVTKSKALVKVVLR
ncbi:MAG: hypothetical protein JO322_04290 [Candidatus Eremiobacteraeota bacterium]|nr:hypothetical protein [Candidatus Eremiobacteraeota bacterium]